LRASPLRDGSLYGGPSADDPTRGDAILADLIARIPRRDEAALRALYDRTAPKLLGVVLRIQADRGMAEDVLRDVFLRIWQKAASYGPAAGGPPAWLCTVARNRAIDGVLRTEVQGWRSRTGRIGWSGWPPPRQRAHDRDATSCQVVRTGSTPSFGARRW
jgi:DNA-directed RNA polymerase specialized sigma24 family protein